MPDEVTASHIKKSRIVRTGFKRVYTEITDAQNDRLGKAALADDRKGGAAEELSVLVKRNIDKILDDLELGEEG
jgi:hypothetical protein